MGVQKNFNLTDDLISDLSKCVNGKTVEFQKGEFIPVFHDGKAEIGIILDGEVSLMKSDKDGNWICLDHFYKEQLLSRLWIYNEEGDLFFTSNKKTKILFIDYLFLLHGCNPLCNKHTKIVTFIFQSLLTYTTSLNMKITILQKKNMQDKLLSYFYLCAKKEGKMKFELSLSYKELADFLGVDRSSLMRKLKDLEMKKYIIKKGKTIILKNISL